MWNAYLKRDEYPIAPEELGAEIPFDGLLEWLFLPANRQRTCNHLDRYYGLPYSGASFEWFVGHRGEKSFEPWNVLAVEALSVTVPTSSARWLLEPNAARDRLLTDTHEALVPGADSLWTCDEKLLKSGGSLYELYELMRSQPGLGPVKTSKIMASMFPNVVPIRDSMVERLLGLTDSTEWWMPFRSKFLESDGQLGSFLDGLPLPSGTDVVTTLRRLDVVLWMEAKARMISKNPDAY
jgi:hypothetical protein